MARKAVQASVVVLILLTLALLVVLPVPVYAKHMLAELRSVYHLTVDNEVYPRVIFNFGMMSLASAIVAVIFGGYSISDAKMGAEKLLCFSISGAFMSFLTDMFLLWLSPLFWASLWVNGNRGLLSAIFSPTSWPSLWMLLLIGCIPIMVIYFFLSWFILRTPWSSSILVAAVLTMITFLGWMMMNSALVQIPESGDYRLMNGGTQPAPECIDSDGGASELNVVDVGVWNDMIFVKLRYDGLRAFLPPQDWRSIIIHGATLDSSSGETVYETSSPLLNRTTYDGSDWSGIACRSLLDENSNDVMRRNENLSITCSGMLPQPVVPETMQTYWTSDRTFSVSVSLSNCTASLSGRWIATAN